MSPVSVMPVAAILRGIGYWVDPVGWGSDNVITTFLIESGSAIVDNLPILFVVGVGIGMVKERDSMIVISAVISYVLLNHLLSVESISLFVNIPEEQVPMAFENSSNAFISILVGLIRAFHHNKFSKIKLPTALSFFGDKKFVLIICSLTTLGLDLLLLIVWPTCFNLFIQFGEIMSGLGLFGAGLYNFYNRLLIPTGLYHALDSVF